MSDFEGSVLFVDDEEPILESLVRATRGLNLDIETSTSAEAALQRLKKKSFDIIVSDKNMPGISGNELLQRVAEEWPETVRIMLTAYTDLDDVLIAINSGKIWSYMKKPWDNTELKVALKQALEFSAIVSERSLLRRTLDQINALKKRSFMGFIGSSAAMQLVYESIQQASPSQASVFITGPSGAGKELVAEAVHNLSTRKTKPFICLNCAAIPSELMESEVFGHVKGAFSGAVANREGAAILAHGGTLFFDELGEMDIGLQAKLLRFIQTGTFKKVGSNKLEKVDIRFVSATNRSPQDAINAGRLREDLYYRLNVISIRLPALSERDKDPSQIANHFLKKFSELENKVFVGFEQDALKLIDSFEWPGNVRQLENIIHSAVIMNEGPLLSAASLASQLHLTEEQVLSLTSSYPKTTSSVPAIQESPSPVSNGSTTDSSPIQPLAQVERATIEHAIALCDENIVKAASMLEVSPSTLYRKIQQWQE
jgi:two-component system repressor protein LuxO